MIEVSRPLSIGVPVAVFRAIEAREKCEVRTRKNPRKDRFFTAKRPLRARVHVPGMDLAFLREIARIEDAGETWVVILG